MVKFGIEHADPWILHNLRRLRPRRVRVGRAGRPAHVASADAGPADRWRLYDEALATLRSRTDELRGSDEDGVDATVLAFDRMMEALERRIGDPDAAYDDTPFRLGVPDARLTLRPDRRGGRVRRAGGRAVPAVPYGRARHHPPRAADPVRAAAGTGTTTARTSCCAAASTATRASRSPSTWAATGGSLPSSTTRRSRTCRASTPAASATRPELAFDRCRTCHQFHPGFVGGRGRSPALAHGASVKWTPSVGCRRNALRHWGILSAGGYLPLQEDRLRDESRHHLRQVDRLGDPEVHRDAGQPRTPASGSAPAPRQGSRRSPATRLAQRPGRGRDRCPSGCGCVAFSARGSVDGPGPCGARSGNPRSRTARWPSPLTSPSPLHGVRVARVEARARRGKPAGRACCRRRDP